MIRNRSEKNRAPDKTNAEEVYNGTKISYVVRPAKRYLYEILLHIRQFSVELFQDTEVEFDMDTIDQALGNIHLPMEYSRNMTMNTKS